MNEPNDVLPARVYWLVALAAVVVMVALYAFTAIWNVPLEGA